MDEPLELFMLARHLILLILCVGVGMPTCSVYGGRGYPSWFWSGGSLTPEIRSLDGTGNNLTDNELGSDAISMLRESLRIATPGNTFILTLH